MTCPFESNIHKQHIHKSDKYAHFETDVKQYHIEVVAFGVGSRGLLTRDNTHRLQNVPVSETVFSKQFSLNFFFLL